MILDVFGIQKLRIQRHTMQERAGAYASPARERKNALREKSSQKTHFWSSGCNAISSD